MNVHAMICELNPLHNGHLSVIERMKNDDPGAAILLVMSGNFTQRAGAAMFDKYARGRSALECGADLVVELPFPFSSSGAESFGRAGVQIAEGLGASRLYFGSECGDAGRLRLISDVTGSEEYRELSAELGAGDATLGAAAVRERALSLLIPGYAAERTETPNDTLAIEYIRNAHVPCTAVKRLDTASASAIRTMADGEAGRFVPRATLDMMEREKRSDAAKFRRILWESLRLRRDPIGGFAECGGGLGDRLIRLSRESTSAEEFFAAAATKRYTNTRIMRAALFAALGVMPQDLMSSPRCPALLAASARGRELLSARRKENPMPIVTKPADMYSVIGGMAPETADEARRLAELGRIADELYTLTLEPPRDADYYVKCRPYIG